MVNRFALLAWLWLLPCALAQDPAKLDAQRITSGEFRAERFGPARWLDGAHYATLEPKAGTDVLELVRYAAESGERTVLVTAVMLWLPAAGRALHIEDYAFSPDGTQLLVFTQSERVWRQNTRGEYYVLPLDGAKEPQRLGGALPVSTLQFAKWSPDGTRVAYVAQNDLYVEAVATKAPTRLTKDGSRTVINGTFDWVYEEEFDCRDGFRWSPDGASIAFWQLDCSGVGEFLMIDNLGDRYSKPVPVQYPKAGTLNSACKVGVVPANGGAVRWMATPGDPRETYIPRMEWHPKGQELMVQWLPRAQNVLQVLGCDVKTGACRVVHEERDEAYVDVRDDFRWVYGGDKFFWTSDTAFAKDGEPRFRQCGTVEWDTRGKHVLVSKVALTSGFDVIEVAHFDAEAGRLYVLAGKGPGGATGQTLWRVESGNVWSQVGDRRYGSGPPGDQAARSEGQVFGGWHQYAVGPDGRLALHTFSSMGFPPHVEVVRLAGHESVRTLVDNRPLADRVAKLALGEVAFGVVKLQQGDERIELDTWTMFPPGFDAAKKWPVVFHVYGEPWSQTVKDTWDLNHHLFHRWLTQLGYVVMSIDARGTPAPKGRDWRKALFQKIGITSSADWNAAVLALRKQHAWMDPQRQAIWGWSGGGAMTLNMLFRYPDLFAAGMSVAPVTDITLYDTIYQERYCGDPRRFPEVYLYCSPITFAKNLQAKLLLVHGTGDDNVHYQNSERLVDELVKHGKLFEFLAYPNRSHGIAEGEGTRAHLYASLADFLQRRVPAGPR